MKTKNELLKELVGKEVVFDWSEGGSPQFAIWDYSKYVGTDFKKEFGHHVIIEVGDDMVKTKWLGQKSLVNHFNRSGYFSINNISFIQAE